MTQKPSPALLDEYGLTDYHYDALRSCEHPTYWRQGDLSHSIQALYKLIDRGLLTGPKRGKPYSEPFHLTDKGRKTLTRLERGLHHPEWITEPKANALTTIRKQGELYAPRSPLPFGFTMTTLHSLERAGYVRQVRPYTWVLTDVGLDAWVEHEEGRMR